MILGLMYHEFGGRLIVICKTSPAMFRLSCPATILQATMSASPAV